MTVKRLAVLAKVNPDDIQGWSGLPYHMTAELRRRFETVDCFYPPPVRARRLRRKIAVLREHLTGRRSIMGMNKLEFRARARSVARQIRRSNPDLVFVIGIDNIAAHLDLDIPIVYHSDATFAVMRDYYPGFSSLTNRSAALGDECAKRIIQRAKLKIYPSDWSAQSAINDYNAPPDTVITIPYGANIASPPTRHEATSDKPRDCCHLLMIGGNWHRKGGDIAVQTAEELDRRGVPCELSVIGQCPVEHPLVNAIGFLNKNSSKEYKQYLELWSRAHFFILPTIAECFGMVFAEAAAWGVPSISTDTGGIPSAIENNRTGVLLPIGASPENYADTIEQIWNDKNAYRAMVTNTRDRYESTLNWSAWGEKAEEFIRTHIP